MTMNSSMHPGTRSQEDGDSGRVFGIRLGDFGLFASLLLSFAMAFASFFAATFVSIFAILIYNTAGHHTVDFADAYKWIALPLALVVLTISLVTLGFFWIRRKVRGN
jgi:hypothetical protein